MLSSWYIPHPRLSILGEVLKNIYMYMPKIEAHIIPRKV